MKPLILFLLPFLCSCIKEPVVVDDVIVIEGNLTKELTGQKMRVPLMYADMCVYLSETQPARWIGCNTIDDQGHYKISINAKAGQQAYIKLNSDYESAIGIVPIQKIVLENQTNVDYVLPCTARRQVTASNVSGNPCDSISMTVFNSTGTFGATKFPYKNSIVFTLLLRGSETNTLITQFYRNGTTTQRQDTIMSACNAYYQSDTLNY